MKGSRKAPIANGDDFNFISADNNNAILKRVKRDAIHLSVRIIHFRRPRTFASISRPAADAIAEDGNQVRAILRRACERRRYIEKHEIDAILLQHALESIK